MLKSEVKAVELAATVHAFLNRLNDAQLEPFLAHWPSEPFRTRSIVPNPLPVVSFMHAVVHATNAEVAFIVNGFRSSTQYLQWGQTYVAEDFGAAFLKNYGWAELIGQRGPIASDRIAY